MRRWEIGITVFFSQNKFIILLWPTFDNDFPGKLQHSEQFVWVLFEKFPPITESLFLSISPSTLPTAFV